MGNHKVYNPDGTENTTSTFIGNINPIRYRGYYFDTETGLFWVQSRYYDPEVGRWISPDSIDCAMTQMMEPNGLNLYAYCLNNPVMYSDPTGRFVLTSFLIGLGIAALIGAGIGAVSYAGSVVISGVVTGDWNWSWGMFAGSVLGGAIGGALSFAFPGLGIAFAAGITGFASNAIGMGLQNAFGEANHSFGDIMLDSLIVGGISAVTAGLTSKMKIPGLTGRGSISQVARQISTKFYNGSIGRITMKTFWEMVVYEAFYSVFNTIASGVWDAYKYYTKPKSSLPMGPLYWEQG